MNQNLTVFILETTCLKIKDGAYVIHLDEHSGIGTHWVALFCTEVKLFISIPLVLSIFLKKLKILSGIETSKLPFFEYKQAIQ